MAVDPITSLFVPEAPLPAVRRQPRVGELQLLRAVLEDARWCYLGRAGPILEQMRAREWVESRDVSPFSFEWICEVLDLDAAAVRRTFERERRDSQCRRWTVRGQAGARTGEGVYA